MRKLALVLFAFVGFTHGMNEISRYSARESYVLFTLKDVPESVFSLRKLGSRMGWEGALASFIHVSYDEYHGLKMFEALDVNVLNSEDEIKDALEKAFHKEVIIQPVGILEHSPVASEN